MCNICGDNRFDVIKKAKKCLLENTNIETNENEMNCIDNILFRCWQMGWLDMYDNTKHVPDIKELNTKLYNCYRTGVTSDEDVEWNRAIYRALRIVNGEE